VAGALEALPVSAVPARFEQAFLTLLKTIEREPAANRSLCVISDFRRHDWLGGEGGVPKQLAALAAKVPDLTLIDVGQPVAADLAITDVRCDERILTAGVACPFRLTVVNRGTRDSDGADVAITAERAPAGRVTLPAMAAGASRDVFVPVTFTRAGPVTVETELTGGDSLAMDNRRDYAGAVEAAIRVLVVDGEPDPDAVRSESFFLRHALAPPGGRVSGVEVAVVDENSFDPANLEGVRVLFLCNVYRLAPEHWRAVADWVRRGGGLAVFPGDQVDGAFWNETASAPGPGFFPVRFEETAGDPSGQEWQALRITRPDHPVLQAFAGDRNPFLQRVKVFRYWRMQPAVEPAAAVLATFGNGRAALAETLFGAGRVLVFATAADTEWSNWPSDPSYVVTLQQVVRNLARAGVSDRVLTVGQPLRYEFSPSRYRGEARLFPPQAREAELLRATESTRAAAVVFEYGALRQPGLWTLELTTHEGEVVPVSFAVNIAAEESDLEGLERGELLRRAGSPGIRFVEGPKIPDVNEAAQGQSELTRLLAVVLIGVLVLEQGLAWWVGWRRRAR
jgi:hypothetical protein